MVLRPRNGLSLCAGAGGLDLGLMLAEPGFHTRCWVEWDEHPRAAIIAGQKAGYFAPAPIWDDVTTFDGTPYRGAIDTILAGYPCQPFSAAGQRKGENDERHLWPDIARIIREIDPRWVFLENVSGHVSLGAETVLREIWGMDRTPAAGLFTASEVSAPHKRERWFCVAYRAGSDGEWDGGQSTGRERSANGSPELADTKKSRSPHGRGGAVFDQPSPEGGKLADSPSRGQRERGDAAQSGDSGHADGESQPVAYTDGRDTSAERKQRGGQQRFQPGRYGTLENTGRAERREGDAEGHKLDGQEAGRIEGTGGVAEPSEALDHPTGPRHGPEGRSAGHQGGAGDTGSGDGAGGQTPDRPFGSRDYLFPPSPSDTDAWANLLATTPFRAPAHARRDLQTAALNLAALVSTDALASLEQRTAGVEDFAELWALAEEAADMVGYSASIADFRQLAHGLAHRTRALRMLGNGVLPLVAAHAWRTLSTAHGLVPMDLEAACKSKDT